MGWDERAVLWLNHLLAQTPQTFQAALFLSDLVPWILSSAVLAALWFAKGEEQAEQWDEEDPVYQHRLAVLTTLIGAVLAFAFARPIAYFAARPVPLTWLPLQAPVVPEVWQRVVEVFSQQRGAFPSDHAAFWGALVAGVWLVSRRWSGAVFLGAAFFAVLRVGLGYHYPTDMVAGFALGVMGQSLAYALRGKMSWFLNPFLMQVDTRPHWAYALGVLVLFDISQRMAWFFGFLATWLGIYLPH